MTRRALGATVAKLYSLALAAGTRLHNLHQGAAPERPGVAPTRSATGRALPAEH